MKKGLVEDSGVGKGNNPFIDLIDTITCLAAGGRRFRGKSPKDIYQFKIGHT